MFSAQNSQVSNNINYIEDVFSTYLYAGNGSTQTITNGIDLSGKGGLIWTKSRNLTNNNNLVNTIAGVGKSLASNNTAVQQTQADQVTAFNSNGYTLGNDAVQWEVNRTGYTYASWTFREQPKFFDIVTYTGTGSNTTIPHNLGSVPGCIIIKRTDAIEDWNVYHRSLANTQYMILSGTAAALTGTTRWNSTTPTSTVFSLGTSTIVNASGGSYVAYVFAHDAGGFGLTGTDNVISCGSAAMPGSGSLNITLGYEPQFIIIKQTNSTGDWFMFDALRDLSLTNNNALKANLSSAESSVGVGVSINSTGFSLPTAFWGTSPNTFIYIAIRRGPMKVPTLGTNVFAPIARTGTGSTAIVSCGFPPDLVIPTARTVGFQRGWYDRLRGPNQSIASNSTGAELTTADSITTFGQDSATYGTENSVNIATYTFANWFMRRAPGFFDEVCYTGTGSATTQAHNLTVIPELMIIKKRNSATNGGWLVGRYISASLVQDGVGLNVPDAFPAARAWSSSNFNSAPTSTVFGIGGYGSINASGDTYVAYLFATCAGVSKVGSYTGNGTTQTINCGFTGGARFVLIKRTDATGDWYVYDTARGMTTLTDPYLLLNSTAAEAVTLGSVTTVTTGFALNSTILAAINVNAGTYIFLAIA